MGVETVNGKELSRCSCGNLIELGYRQDACDELTGETYVSIIDALKKKLDDIIMESLSCEDAGDFVLWVQSKNK